VAAWIGIALSGLSGLGTNGYAVSRDHGATFTEPRLLDGPEGLETSDPVLAVDRQGQFYLVFIGFNAADPSSDMHVFASKLDPTTDKFVEPVEVSDPTAQGVTRDKPWITIGNDDSILLTWTESDANFGITTPTFAKGRWGGPWAWSAIADGSSDTLIYPCLDPAGGVGTPIYATYIESTSSAHSVILRKSTDGGQTWRSPASTAVATDAVFEDPTCAAHGQDLWVAYGRGSYSGFDMTHVPTANAIVVVHSGDGGQTWDAPVVASNGVSGTQYQLPQITLAPDGSLTLFYYQGAIAQAATLVRALSADGTTWNDSTAAMPGRFLNDRTGLGWLGDYLGVAYGGTTEWAAFGDNSGACSAPLSTSTCTHIRVSSF
jgi:hypothetical protein